MAQIGADPMLIHACRRTGRFVTTENWKYLSEAERAEWEAVCEEYRELSNDGRIKGPYFARASDAFL